MDGERFVVPIFLGTVHVDIGVNASLGHGENGRRGLAGAEVGEVVEVVGVGV